MSANKHIYQDQQIKMTPIKQILSNILFSPYDRKLNIAVASIHATFLSIMIGLSSAYVLHINNQINLLETEAIAIADEVNNINFSPIWFNLVSSAGMFIEKWESTEDQMGMWLDRYFIDPSGETLTRFDDSPPFGVYFKDIGLNHTEVKLCLIASLALRSPFPDRLVIKKKAFRGLAPSPNKIFKNKRELEDWMKEVKEIFMPIVHAIKWFGVDNFINGFNWSEITYIRGKFFKSDKSKYNTEELEKLKKIPKEFTTNVIEIYDICRSVENKINRINYLEKLLPSPFWRYFILFFAFITFISGIIIPIINPSINKFFIVWLPALFYCVFLTYFIVKVSGIIS